MSRWVRGAPIRDNDADHTPPDDETASLDEGGLGGSACSTARQGRDDRRWARSGHEPPQEPGIDLDWLPEPERSQALNGRAAAYDDTGRCSYHTPPYRCTLIDGGADRPGLLEVCGLTPAELTDTLPGEQMGTTARSSGAPRPHADASHTDAATEVRNRPANLITWCERCTCGRNQFSAR